MKRSRIDMPYTTDLGEAIDAMRKRTVSLAWLAALTGLLALTSCDSATNSGMGTMRLHLASSDASTMLSDAAAVGFGEVTGATVTIYRAELMPGHEDIPLTTTVFELVGDEDPTVPSLVDGVTALLGVVETLGEYEQLRLFVSSATIDVNVNGTPRTFQFDEDSLVPSGQQTGIKVNFGGPIEVGPDATVDLIAVFDVDDSFVFQGPPSAPRSVSFKPVIHAATESWGYIEGDVTLSVPPGSATTITVEALRTSDNLKVSQVLNVAADATVAHYHLGFLPAGEYIVTASADSYTSASSAPVIVGTVGVVIDDLALVK